MSNDIKNILIVGVGGQGVILASDILSKAAMIDGFDAKKSEIHGMSQRGGSVFSHVRFGKNVASPVISRGEVDILVSMEEMETARWAEYCNPNTVIIMNAERIIPQGSEEKDYPEGLIDGLTAAFKNVIQVKQKDVVIATGKPKSFNVAVLGIVSQFAGISENAWKEAINAEVPAGTFDDNWAAFQYGASLVQK